MTTTQVRTYLFNDDHKHREIVDTLIQNIEFLVDFWANGANVIIVAQESGELKSASSN